MTIDFAETAGKVLRVPELGETETQTQTLAPAPRPSAPNPSRESRLDRVLTHVVESRSLWLTPILLLQAILSFRLNNSLEEDEALYINAGHQIIAHVLHGTRSPGFGSYFSGVPAVYSVPAAMLDHVGGAPLVIAANTLMAMLATVFVYLSARRMFGQGAALIAGGIFGLYPAVIFIGRTATFDAPSMLFLSVALFMALRATKNWQCAVGTGAFLILAGAEKYFALAFIPSVLILLVVVNRQRVGWARTKRALVLAGATAVTGAGIAVMLMSSQDWQGITATSSINRAVLLPESRMQLLGHSFHYVGVLATVGVLGVALAGRRRLVSAVLVASGLLPVILQFRLGEGESLHKNIAFGMIFLAPAVGATAVALVRRGSKLAVRAPLALVGVIALLSSGTGTSQAMVNGWPNTDQISRVMAGYVQPGPDRYLVDGSQIEAYYLSGLTSYPQWWSTYDADYVGAHGTALLRHRLKTGYFTVFLYRDNGPTAALDHQMLPILRANYTLAARIPVSPTDTHDYWNLWTTESTR